MPKKPNLLSTELLTISTTVQVVECLKKLVATGFYGKNPTEAAERLLARGLEQMIEQGKLQGPTSETTTHHPRI